MHDGVPLVVADVNSSKLLSKKPKIIASPNCVATPLTQVLGPIHELSKLSQVLVSTYQAVSGAGKSGTDELESQVRSLFNMRDLSTETFGQQIAFNVLPFVPAYSPLCEEGKTEEETKVLEETKKILDLPHLKIDVTCARVPVFNAHSMAVNIATKNPIKINDVLDTLTKAPGIIVVDDPSKAIYPSALLASGQDKTLVGRIRKNTAAEHGVSLWIASDNLRTGAALNAVRIAEKISVE